MDNHMPRKAWDEITYPFPNFNVAAVDVCEWISNFIPHYCACNYLSMLGLKLVHFSKRTAETWRFEHNRMHDGKEVSGALCLLMGLHPQMEGYRWSQLRISFRTHRGLVRPWPGEVIRWQRCRSTLAAIMTCCLRAPSHHPNRCWLLSKLFCGTNLRQASQYSPILWRCV